MTQVWLVRADCNDFYCGCGGGHVLAVAESEDEAIALAHVARLDTSNWSTVIVSDPLQLGELYGIDCT